LNPVMFHANRPYLGAFSMVVNITRVLNWCNEIPRSQTRVTRFGQCAACVERSPTASFSGIRLPDSGSPSAARFSVLPGCT
jgi:hypothetical protein